MKSLKSSIYFSILFVAMVALCPSIVGASFDHDLSYGMTENSDVTLLQTFLTLRGLYAGPINGNYFSLTRQSVSDFQTQEGILPVSGYFGSASRTIANSLIDFMVSSTTTGDFALFASSTISNSGNNTNLNVNVTTGSPPHDYSVDIATLASTTDTLNQEFATLSSEYDLLQSEISDLTNTVNTMNANIQLLMQVPPPPIQPIPAPTSPTPVVSTTTTINSTAPTSPPPLTPAPTPAPIPVKETKSGKKK